jgi:predicted MFS family arabinose efflux permease
VIGAYTAGVLGGHRSRKYLLSGIYLARAVAFLLFFLIPTTPVVVLAFGAVIGLLWLSTVPLTSGLVALMFGTRNVGLLFGFVFLSHQVGAFIGVWLGGAIYDATGAYDAMWWLSIALGVFAAVVHLPISERQAPRYAVAPA